MVRIDEAIIIEYRELYVEVGKNKRQVNKDMIEIAVYSARKIIINGILMYSTLNPETSSDSPSAKSKGVRLVSLRIIINHIMNRGIIINNNLKV